MTAKSLEGAAGGTIGRERARNPRMPRKFHIKFDKSAEHALAERAKRLTPRGPPLEMSPKLRAIHFLRGVHSTATLALPAFYLFLGAATSNADPDCAIAKYPGLVLKYTTKYSSINLISLCCRKAFDHAAKGLTGADFGKISDETLKMVAEYWSSSSSRPIQDAVAALNLLRSVFRDCAKTDRDLLDGATVLGRRIGLLKQHADRSAAHLSLDRYEFDVLDCAHVVAALTVFGEIIRSFDDSSTSPTYFDTLNEASFSAAMQLFPAGPDVRLFDDIQIEVQSRLCWQWGIDRGRQMLLEELPYAMGWY